MNPQMVHKALVSQNLLRAANDGYDVSPLIESGADPMSSDVDGRLAIHYAAMNGHTMSMLTLAAYGADINSALRMVDNETVTALVTIMGADVSAVDCNGRGCLHFASLNGHGSMVQTLVNLSADVECKDHDGCRPLHLAAWNGHRECVQMLLRLGADPRTNDGNLSTALHDAALSGRTCVARLLVESKADVEARNNRGITPLHSAASSGHVDTTCLLLDAKANIDAVNDDRRSALHFATWNCHPRTVLLLLQYGADMSLSGEDGVMASDGLCHPDFDWPPDLLRDLHSLRMPNSPMHTAAGAGDKRRVTFLAGCGVDVNCQNSFGDTPLHWAVRNRRLGTSTRLLELGADVMRSNDSAVTVRKDVLMYMDVLQQECIQRKLEELIALQPARAAASSPKAHSPRAAAHSSSSSSSSSLLSDAHLSWQLPSISEHDLPERKKTMPVHHHRSSAPGTPGTPVTTPP
eukprot:CAMPEP_0179425986 /NCGR_PEP_ID=MMETSP0799-20121207/12478_1 /TAXON_ID=46947 /ORGANISM="Geminigera cryophila, Strain CCMP2564" /LENGTH=462 /DNA_ID=CAMNT_0021200669 /DNA_START=48 /DNA_END=1433 /DNA_ORIENTATION=+